MKFGGCFQYIQKSQPHIATSCPSYSDMRERTAGRIKGDATEKGRERMKEGSVAKCY